MTESFTIVRFSPSPEYLDFVNVALLFTGSENRFFYDPLFPKLNCVTAGYNVSLLRKTLDWANDRIGALEPQEAAHFLPRMSGQFAVGEFAALDSELSGYAPDVLIKKLLSRPAQKSRKERQQVRVEKSIAGFIDGTEEDEDDDE